jgi:hypothetical protein
VIPKERIGGGARGVGGGGGASQAPVAEHNRKQPMSLFLPACTLWMEHSFGAPMEPVSKAPTSKDGVSRK